MRRALWPPRVLSLTCFQLSVRRHAVHSGCCPNLHAKCFRFVPEDERVNHLSKLKIMLEWVTMVEELPAFKGNALTGVVHTLAEVVLDTKHRIAIVPFPPSLL